MFNQNEIVNQEKESHEIESHWIQKSRDPTQEEGERNPQDEHKGKSQHGNNGGDL